MTEQELPKSESKAEEAAKATPQWERKSALSNFFLALKMVNEASLAENVKQRASDYVSIALVCLCIVSLLMAVTMQVAPGIKLLPLLFTVGAVGFYIVNRLGIMISLTPRQAVIVWQILVASIWLGITTAMLVMLGCIYFFSQGSLGGS